MTKQIKAWQEKHLYPLLPLLTNTKSITNVIFLRGISGSGKSTLSNCLSHLLDSEKVISLSADNYFTINGVYKFKINKISEAHKECVKSLELALQSTNIRYIIMDNTHTRLWHLHDAENLAKNYGATIYYIDIVVPDKPHFLLCLKRQCHNVPEGVLLDQWVNWEEIPNSIRIPMFISEEEMQIKSAEL
jgi:predicted kinase